MAALKRLLFICLLLSVTCGKAQLLDTLQDLFRHKYSIDARLESRNGFIDNKLSSVSGVRLGLAFQRKFRFGLGVSWLKTQGSNWFREEISKDFYYANNSGGLDTVSKYLKLAYLCLYADFVFYKTKRWQLSVPIQLGFGKLWYQAGRNYVFSSRDPKYFLFLYEPGITVQYKIFKWAGLGTDVAYRFAMQNKKASGVHLSSPSLTFKLLLWFDQLFYDLFPHSEITRRFGPSYW